MTITHLLHGSADSDDIAPLLTVEDADAPLANGYSQQNNDTISSNLCPPHLPNTITTNITRSSAIAGRPHDAKACQKLLKWTWK